MSQTPSEQATTPNKVNEALWLWIAIMLIVGVPVSIYGIHNDMVVPDQEDVSVPVPSSHEVTK